MVLAAVIGGVALIVILTVVGVLMVRGKNDDHQDDSPIIPW